MLVSPGRLTSDTESADRRGCRSARQVALGGIAALLLVLTAAPAVGQEDSVAVAAADSAVVADSISAAADSAIAEADTLRDSHPPDAPEATGFVFPTPARKGPLSTGVSLRLVGAYDFNGRQYTAHFGA